MAVSDDGSVFVFANIAGPDGDSFVVRTGNNIYVSTSYIIGDFGATISSVALAGDGDLVAATTVGAVYVASPESFGGSAWGYGPGQFYAVGGSPTAVALGDFNRDGNFDIVTANANGTASVLLNNGNDTFATAQNYAVAGPANSVAVGDFNRDGKLDIVTANANGTVSVLLNNGTFATAQNYAVAGPANSVAVGDFNHDGFLDVVTTGAEMDLLLNNGNGTFAAYQQVGPAGSSVVAADFNGDGFPDLAQIDASQANIDVVLNNADWMPGPVSLSFGSITYNSKKNLYSETVTLTNNTGGTLTSPLSLELTNLLGGVVLTDATGTTSGNPYLRFLSAGKTLKPGASLTITLTFTAPSLSDITFGTELVAL
jgi:hypothetical protein